MKEAKTKEDVIHTQIRHFLDSKATPDTAKAMDGRKGKSGRGDGNGGGAGGSGGRQVFCSQNDDGQRSSCHAKMIVLLPPV